MMIEERYHTYVGAAKAVDLKVSKIGKTLSLEEIEASLKEHKPAALFLCQVCLLFAYDFVLI